MPYKTRHRPAISRPMLLNSRSLQLSTVSRLILFFLFFQWLALADTAAFIAAPLAGKAVQAGMFFLAAAAFWHVDHPSVIWQLLK